MGSMNDWPEFEIDSSGRKTRWTRYGNQPAAYVVGKKVRLDYVMQKAKKPMGNVGVDQEVPLRIAVEP